MGQRITFYPLGNAESCLIELGNGKKLMFDYANTNKGIGDKRIDLSAELADCGDFDVVLFSHAHEDHVKGASEFFYMEHAQKYQSDDRHKMTELWVSTAFLLETDVSCEDVRVIRQEARARLRAGSGIKLFAEPEILDKWLASQNISYASIAHLVVCAGEIVPHTLGAEVQFFAHAPFAENCEDVDDKNDPSIVLQMRLFNGTRATNILFTGDTPYTVLDSIVDKTKYYHNEEYLKWDLYDIPHHCSSTGLAALKGDDITIPTDNVQWLLSQSQQAAKMVASCEPITTITSPPDMQAKKAYQNYTAADVEFFATMEYPTVSKPLPLVFEIDEYGLTKQDSGLSTANWRTTALRAG